MFLLSHARFSHLFPLLEQTFFSSEKLINFANVVHSKGVLLNNCWGFIHDTAGVSVIMLKTGLKSKRIL